MFKVTLALSKLDFIDSILNRFERLAEMVNPIGSVPGALLGDHDFTSGSDSAP
jgi:hypothetical protein